MPYGHSGLARSLAHLGLHSSPMDSLQGSHWRVGGQHPVQAFCLPGYMEDMPHGNLPAVTSIAGIDGPHVTRCVWHTLSTRTAR